MQALSLKKDLILNHEGAFANAVGRSVFDKPQVSFWMILLPILFLHFIYRMQKYKSGRLQFNKDFMVTRRQAVEAACKAVAAGTKPDGAELVENSGLAPEVRKPYAVWVQTLLEHYQDLLTAEGRSFEALVRSAYGNRTTYLLMLNRLSAVERDFYSALKPGLAEVSEASAVIAKIEDHSRRLRRESAEQIFS